MLPKKEREELCDVYLDELKKLLINDLVTHFRTLHPLQYEDSINKYGLENLSFEDAARHIVEEDLKDLATSIPPENAKKFPPLTLKASEQKVTDYATILKLKTLDDDQFSEELIKIEEDKKSLSNFRDNLFILPYQLTILCNNYLKDLKTSLIDELTETIKKLKSIDLLYLMEEHDIVGSCPNPNHRQIATDLLEKELDSISKSAEITAAKKVEPNNIATNLSIEKTSLSAPFIDGIKKFCIVSKLKSSSLETFYPILQANQEELSKRRDTAFMTFMKGVMVIASNLGCFFAYQRLFGKKATKGKQFYNKAVNLKPVATQTSPPEPDPDPNQADTKEKTISHK